MLKKLSSIKLNEVFATSVKSVTLTEERVVFNFNSGIPAASYNIKNETGLEMYKTVLSAYGAEKAGDFINEEIYIKIVRKGEYLNTQIQTVLVEEPTQPADLTEEPSLG